MEEHNSSLSSPESVVSLSASALRDLQQRAQAALVSSREQAAQLEAEINQQLDTIAATLSEQAALESQTVVDVDAVHAEVARLTEELQRSRTDWLAERTDLAAQRDDLAGKLKSAETERERLNQNLSSAESTQSDLVKKLTELEIEREILGEKVATLTSQKDDISPKLSSLETIREDLTNQVISLETEKGTLAKKLTNLDAQRDELSEKLSIAEAKRDELFQKLADLELQHENLCRKVSKLEAHSDEVTPKVGSLEALRDDLSRKVNTLESEKASLSETLASLGAERDELSRNAGTLEADRDELAKKVARLERERDDLTQIASNYEVQRNDLSEKVAALDGQIQLSQAEWRNQLLDFESRLREQQESWTEQRSEWTQTRAGLEHERDELQQKFDLAVQDLQRLKARVAELEHDLARRPESNQADSAELVALRAERDALAARIEELEQRPTAQIDANVEQQLSDLQRRFELAVEDLREYKTKCGKLESQLAAASSQSRTVAPDIGGNDWESQKRRLLAALEESANTPETPVEKQQRITIEGTIEMTDAVVAEKDRQIAELKTQLAGRDTVDDVDHTRKVDDLVDADEVIAEHRKRVRELEREMQEKLRAAELELSVERAKIARQKVDLDELKSDLESKKLAFESSGGATIQGQPKRRWRDKLGLSGDE